MEGMESALMFSEVSSRHPDLKTMIISALAKRPKQGARELHGRLLREYSYRVSYQGVHKALTQLFSKEVLNRAGTKYLLSRDWVTDAREFLSDLDGVCAYQRPFSVLELLPFNAMTIKSVGPLIEPYLWMLRQMEKIRKEKGPIGAACFQQRTWPLPILGENALKSFRNTFNGKSQIALVGGNKPADRYFAKMWRMCGFDVRLGVLGSQKGEWFVAGEFVFQITHPKATETKWNLGYDRILENGAEGLCRAHQMAFETITPCDLTVTRNGEFANHLRREASLK